MIGAGGKNGPPRLVRFLLGLVVDETELEELDELFAQRVERAGLREARRGYRLELWWGYCQLELFLVCLDVSLRQETTVCGTFLSWGSRFLS